MRVDRLTDVFAESEEREFLAEMVEADLEEALTVQEQTVDDRFPDTAEAYVNNVARQDRRVAFLKELQGGLEASSGQ